jgi:glycosyltransferase involved in cell wall biosynthesis
MRLGVYADLSYIRNDDGVSTDSSFGRLLIELARCAGELTLLGRTHRQAVSGAVELPETITFVELPGYRSLHNVVSVSRVLRRSARIAERTFSDMDAVLLFGPHPLSIMLARRASRRKIPFVLGVRQHFPDYVRGRFKKVLEPAAVASAWALELAFRRLSVHAPTIVAGEDLARRWAGGENVLATYFAVVRNDELSPTQLAGAQPWNSPIQLLTVTRLDPEKNPLLLLEVMRELGSGWHLKIIGDGPLRESMQRRINDWGIEKAVELTGPVKFGPELLAEYRQADAFIHVSNTEGVPQVLFEAMAAGLPIVATDVGGVSAALNGGACGVLVPRGDPMAVAEALRGLQNDAERRRELAVAGRSLVAGKTLEKQAVEIFDFIVANS